MVYRFNKPRGMLKKEAAFSHEQNEWINAAELYYSVNKHIAAHSSPSSEKPNKARGEKIAAHSLYSQLSSSERSLESVIVRVHSQ